jgi:hypothetical protein
MIEPTNHDIGRKVIYRDRCGAMEKGVISSIAPLYVFVRYRDDAHAKATRRQDLEWSYPAGPADDYND